MVPLDESGFGPAMRRLNDRQRAFVVAWFMTGGNRLLAFETAGYTCTNPNVTRVDAFRVYHNEKVQAAIQEFAVGQLGGLLPKAMAAVEEIVSDPTHKDRQRTAMEILSRTGLHARTEHKISIEHNDDRISKLTRLAELARAQGMDPRALIGNLADTVDADYEILDASDGREGLEDIL